MSTGTRRRAALVAGLVLAWAATPAAGRPRWAKRDLFSLQQRGVEVGTALLVEYYEELPEPQADKPKAAARFQAALEKFRQQVAARHTEGTLRRLLGRAAA